MFSNRMNTLHTGQIPLHRLEQHILLQILRRMDTKSLCRFRRTCKYLDEFAEKHRFRISTRREDSNWVLLIHMGSEAEGRKHLKFSINNRRIVDFGEKEWLIHVQENWTNFDYQECFITDPFVQLSAVSLRAVHMSDYFTQLKKPHPFLHNDVIPLFRRLRLHVDWLFLNCRCTPELLTSVNFFRLRVDNVLLSFEELNQMGIQNCRELAFRTEEEHDFLESTRIFSHVETYSIDFFDRSECREYFNNLIEILQKQGDLLGGLKVLRIMMRWCVVRDQTLEYKFTDVEPFYILNISRHTFDFYKMYFYKIPIDGGVAVIVYTVLSNGFIEIFFVKDDSRRTLLDVLWRFFTPSFPSEETIRDFMEAEDDCEALQCLSKIKGSYEDCRFYRALKPN